MNILTIVAIILILGLISMVIEWVHDHFIPILIIAVIVAGLIFFRKITIITLAVGAVLSLIVLFIRFVLVPVFKRINSWIKGESLKRAELKLERRKAKEEEKQVSMLPERSQAFLIKSQECICELRTCNEKIINIDMKWRVERSQSLIGDICTEVKRVPEIGRDMEKLTSYYYPTLCKLVSKYAVYEERNVDDGNVKEEIVKAIDEINSALAVVIQNVIADDNMDVLTDISVVKQMIGRDGLK
ncbi:hypothetical protein [Butyrivibrio fibrisolvens]|uniref:hypothetical protein n=1 Tax=Butyrivibrio fibrisolvens TaxID=831 RepID=UPI000402E73B|nr:hypothetical protein [Butyrivibrio fibrisolvens]